MEQERLEAAVGLCLLLNSLLVGQVLPAELVEFDAGTGRWGLVGTADAVDIEGVSPSRQEAQSKRGDQRRPRSAGWALPIPVNGWLERIPGHP